MGNFSLVCEIDQVLCFMYSIIKQYVRCALTFLPFLLICLWLVSYLF